MTNKLTIGLVQLCGRAEIAENVELASDFIEDAAKRGAKMVMTPEMTGIFDQRKKILFEKTVPEDQDQALKAFVVLAKKLDIHLLVGSLAIKVSDDMMANRSFLITPKGIAARYDKIHMFDVDLPNGESYRESSTFRAGSSAVVAKTPWGGLGMSVCYDLRFPYLYRALAKNGASMIAIPSSFTAVTGKAHWHILIRARAIETGCFVFAPAQSGTHWNGRETYGHSLAVDPWGTVLADAGPDAEGAFLIDVDLDKIDKTRQSIPSLKHDRELDEK